MHVTTIDTNIYSRAMSLISQFLHFAKSNPCYCFLSELPSTEVLSHDLYTLMYQDTHTVVTNAAAGYLLKFILTIIPAIVRCTSTLCIYTRFI